jgi:cytochrome c oxidase assembly protein subunit 17
LAVSSVQTQDSIEEGMEAGAKGEGCSVPAGGPVGPDGKKLKPCCVCKETKRPRDACIIEKGEENCGELIEAHKACMRGLGFKI